MNYQLLDHTADLKIKFFGNTKQDLLKNSSIALSEISFDRKLADFSQINIKKMNLKITEDNFDNLYVDFLREILYNINFLYRYYTNIKFNIFSKNRLKADCFYTQKHESNLTKEIKAVTYHDLDITHVGKGWFAKVTFDI